PTFRLHCGSWVVDCIARQAYNVFVIIAPYERWAWGKTARNPPLLRYQGKMPCLIKGSVCVPPEWKGGTPATMVMGNRASALSLPSADERRPGMPWIAPEVLRPALPRVADERTMLEAWLDLHRQTLLMKCTGLSAEQLKRRSAPPSTLTLHGLV